MEITEYQVIRPDGTVLLPTLVPDGAGYSWGEGGSDIRGPIITRWRVLPDGKWTVTAYFPDGFRSDPCTSDLFL